MEHGATHTTCADRSTGRIDKTTALAETRPALLRGVYQDLLWQNDKNSSDIHIRPVVVPFKDRHHQAIVETSDFIHIQKE
jgi:hypothetical protein